MLGRLVPRSIALICDTFSLVSAASFFSAQNREDARCANHPSGLTPPTSPCKLLDDNILYRLAKSDVAPHWPTTWRVSGCLSLCYLTKQSTSHKIDLCLLCA
jgi:hypothetical protein